MVDKKKPYEPMYEKQREVSIFMASFPFRKKWMIKCIVELIDQCDNFYLWLNEYKEIPEELIGESTGYERKPFGASEVTAGKAGYIKAKEAFAQKAFDPSAYKVKKADTLEYGVGDRVSHIKFREGTVLDIEERPKDYEVTVEFDKAGVKKMYAAFAKLKKI